jgi:type VI secretion system protein ImpH
LRLILKAAEIPALRLGEAGRLGWTTWLKSGPFEQDADDLVLESDTV